MPNESLPRPGERVRVSAEHPWAPDAEGTVTEGWPTWPREVRNEKGEVTTYVLVTFDEPQSDGDERVESAEIDERLLDRA